MGENRRALDIAWRAITWTTVVLAVSAALSLSAVLWLKAPDVYPLQVQPGDSAEVRATHVATRTAAITATRGSILAIAAGIAAFITLGVNVRNSRIAHETQRVVERGHLTDRYAKAVEMLGNNSEVAIRLGGIYAFQHFAKDSGRHEDQMAVVEVLSAFVRMNLPDGYTQVLGEEYSPSSSSFVKAPPDIAAAITVLAQLPPKRQMIRSDFTGLSFHGVDLSGARLRDGYLWQSNLPYARLPGAEMNGLDLTGAALIRADLGHAKLANAILRGADLRHGILVGSVLTNADLREARLRFVNAGNAEASGVDLRKANLSETDFSGADLTRADLRGAHIEGTSFRGATLTGAKFGGVDLTGAVFDEKALSTATLRNALNLDKIHRVPGDLL